MKNLFLLAMVCLLVSCQNDEAKYKLIIGSWHCSSWTSVNDKTNRCENNVFFAFNNDKTYSSQLGDEKDEGTYKISGELLTVQPKDKLPISVEIIKLTSTELNLYMNNAGVEETLELKK